MPGRRVSRLEPLRVRLLAVARLGVVVQLAALPASAANKNIILSDSLLANADKWEFKQANQWLGIHKWRFGDYAVVASKQGKKTTGTHTNFLQTKTESHSKKTFWFIMSNKTNDSAFVNARHETASQSNPGMSLGHGSYVGGDGRTVEVDRFVADIMINRDTTEAWELSILETDTSDRHGESIGGEAAHAAALTSGERRIVLNPVLSKKFDKPPSLLGQLMMDVRPPAQGYEFVEDGRSLCAVEYVSTALAGSLKNTVWMDRNADPRMRLVLAAAMTAVLELKAQVADAPAEPDHE